jgi:hypothetical protein
MIGFNGNFVRFHFHNISLILKPIGNVWESGSVRSVGGCKYTIYNDYKDNFIQPKGIALIFGGFI